MPEDKPPFLSNKAYDALKYLALVLLPALGTLYFAIASIWGLPYAEQVVGTIVAVDTFLGLALRLAAKSYDASDSKYDGVVEVEDKPDGGKTYSLVVHGDPAEVLSENDQLLFKILPPS